MSRKKQNVVTAEVFIQGNTNIKYSEREHILEHVHFLEERTTDLEEQVEVLQEIFRDLLEDDEDKEEDDTEYDDEKELEENDLHGHSCCCLWSRVASY